MTVMTKPPKQTHRADLAGLRGLAVLLVLAYHFDIPPFRGGFIGVDVFFVLSGYLITLNTHRSLQASRFSPALFYHRRITRLAPALFTTLLISGALTPLLWPAQDAYEASLSGAAACVGLSNVDFFLRSGYFDTASLRKPLLHTWSLSIETQFYLLWPPAHALLFSLSARLPGLVAAAAALLGAAAAERAAAAAPSAAFFLLHHRAWELLAGAALALHPPGGRGSAGGGRMRAALREALVCAALAVLLGAASALRATDRFPGHRALLPVLSTCVLVAVPGTAAAHWALSGRALGWLGAASYSVYLVHWPVLVHAREAGAAAAAAAAGGAGASGALAPAQRAGALCAALAGGVALHRAVERPWMARHARAPPPRRFFLAFALAALAAAAAFLALAAGLRHRAQDARARAERALADAPRPAPGGVRGGHVLALAAAAEAMRGARWTHLVRGFAYEVSLAGARAARLRRRRRPRVLLVGDSHAGRLRAVAVRARDAYGADAQVWVARACAPLFDVRKTYRFEPALEADCARIVHGWRRRVHAERFDVVVVAARWTNMVERGVYGVGRFNIDSLVPQHEPREVSIRMNMDALVNRSRRLLASKLRTTAQEIAGTGARVVLVSQVPLQAMHPRECEGRRYCRAISRELAMQRLAFSDAAVMNASMGLPGVRGVCPSAVFCELGQKECSMRMGEAMLYEDKDHLSMLGGALVALRMDKELFEGLGKAEEVKEGS